MSIPTYSWTLLRSLLFLPLIASLHAAPLAHTQQLTVDCIPFPSSSSAEQSFTVGLRFRPQPGWHIYASNPGDSGLPPTVEWQLPPGFTASPLRFPFPHKILAFPLVSYGYTEETILLTEITPSSTWPKGKPFTLRAQLDWLVCKEACLPGSATLSLTLPAKPNPKLLPSIAQAILNLPISDPSFHFTVTPSTHSLDLLLQRPPINLGNVTFFPDNNDWLDEFTPAQLHSSSAGLHLILPLLKKPHLPPLLTGVLLADQPWDSAGHRALRISVPLPPLPSAPSSANSSFSLALLFAFLGGLILNIMPCVFPILSLKALHLVQISGESPTAARREGLAFFAGVLLSLLGLAGLLIILRSSGQALGWGFQLQSPPVVWLLLALLFALALNLLGVFEFQVLLGDLASKSPKQGWTGAFASGLLAVAVASPCTAPFMGVALATAFSLPPLHTLSIFTSLAFGFALPVLLFSYFPSLLSFLPKPGAWMNTLKKILSLPMFAAVLWLLWVAFRLSGTSSILPVLLGLLSLTLGLLFYGQSQRSFPPPRPLRILGITLILLACLLPSLLLKTAPASTLPTTSTDRLPWSEAEVARQLAAGRSVFIDFTAAWCLTCQVNERLTLSSAEIKTAFRERNIAFLVADWTRRDPAITAALQKYGREGVPTYVLLRPSPDSTPQLLPEIITPSIVLEALRR